MTDIQIGKRRFELALLLEFDGRDRWLQVLRETDVVAHCDGVQWSHKMGDECAAARTSSL
jgi:hypothetical protein